MKRMLITDETKYFLRKLGLFHKKKYKIWLTVYIPSWILKIFLGAENTKELILADQKVNSSRLKHFNFIFEKPELKYL